MLVHLTPSSMREFWSYVDRSGGPDACWLWTRGQSNGYGTFYLYTPDDVAARTGRNSIGIGAHRIARALAEATPGDEGVIIDLTADDLTRHRCPTGPNRLCCNPAHLAPGTKKDNVHDAIQDGVHIPFGNGGVVISDAERNRIRDLYESGDYSLSALGKMYGVGYAVIGRIVRSFGVEIRRGRPMLPIAVQREIIARYADGGITMRQLADEFDANVTSVHRIIHK